MDEPTPVIWWVRRDLRLTDNPALHAACATGHPVIPVYVLDPLDEQMGAAPKFRLGLGIESLSRALQNRGSDLVLRRGDAHTVVSQLAQETGAKEVFAARAYHPDEIARDLQVQDALDHIGVAPRWHAGRLLFDPYTVKTAAGGFFKVFTPFWKAVRPLGIAACLSDPSRIPAPRHWPISGRLEDWNLASSMNRGAQVVLRYCQVGEAAALDRLHQFTDEQIASYGNDRDLPGQDATSRLSQNLTWGEISPRQMWHSGQVAMAQGRPGAETFLKQLVWREFAYHLMVHTPHILTENWRAGWERFPWLGEEAESARIWQRGQTGVDFVDAAMRELYTTGYMHNRLRMITASYLCKHLMVHWKIGMKWFEDCLVDWDPACNAMGWQWVAGSGPDAAPFFRVFNPERQRDRFDPKQTYLQRWIAEGQTHPPQTATDFFDAIPYQWRMTPADLRPDPVISLAQGRARALDAYKSLSK